MQYPVNETARAINGVPGRAFAVHAPQDVRDRLVHRNQKWISEARPVSGYSNNAGLQVEIRFDDECANGHQSFAITGDIKDGRGRFVAGGCLHDEIAQTFPELAPLIKWHLTSTEGPMHYVANVLHFASDADCWGRRKGEASAWEHVVYFGDSPVSHKLGGKFAKFLQSRMEKAMGRYQKTGGVVADRYTTNTDFGEFRVVAIAHDVRPGDTYKFQPKYTLAGFGEKWHECPFDDSHTAHQWAEALNTIGAYFASIPTAFSDGKARELDKARNAAIWPEATDEQLCADKETLKAALLGRLPALLAEFRTDMENAGFLWEPEQPARAE